MTVTRKMFIMIMILTITLQALGDTENSVPPGSGSSPTEIPSTRITQDNLLEFEDCPLDNATTACDTAYTASAKKCQSKLSLNQLLQHFFPNVDIQSLINNIVQPEKFDCTKFYINTCKDYVEFQGQSREDIDLVPNRLRIGDATLILRVLYKPLTLYYAAVYFEINGNVYSDSRKLQISCSKDFDNSPITMSMEARQFTIQELERLFSVSAFKSQEMPASVEELKTLSLSSAEIKGYYYSDGYFEFIMKGKVETSTVFSSSMLYLIIQKQVNDEITVGVIAHFAAASFRDILSGVIGEDLPYEIPIIWQEKSDIALHVSSRGIQKVKNADFNRIFRFFIAGRAAVIKGVSLCAAFPFQKFVSQNYPSLKGTYLPLTFLFIADVKKNRIRISFATDINLSLSSALLILTSETNFYAQLTELFEKDSMAEIKWMDLLLRQYEIQISISLTNSVSVVKGFPQIYHFEIILQKHLHTSWKLSGKGKGKISSTEFQTEFKELSNGKFSLAGKTNMVSSQSLFQTFAEYSGLLEIVSQFQFLNFKITNVFISSKVESHLNFRLTGKPEILDSAEAQYSELILYNSTKTSPGLAFGILLKGAGFEALLAKMFGERQQRPAWVQKVDCAIMISNENQNAASKQLTFKISEFNKFILKRGVSIGLTIYLTGDCKGDGLCELLKSQTSASSSEIFLYGRLAQTELEVEWRTVSMQLSTHIELIDVSFRIFGGQKMSYLLEATMKLAVYGLSFKGIISSDVSGGLSIDMQLGSAWKNPFAIKGCLFADMSYKSSLSSFKNLEYFDMEGQVYIGTVHLQRRITGNAIVTINTANAQQSYFYSKVQSLELSGLLDAFEIQYQLPMVMQYAKFIGPVIVGYSHNPLSIRIEDLNLKLENKLTIKGMLSIWGHLGQFLITISEGMLRLEASMPYLSLDNGFVKMTSICDCPDLKKFDGPSLIAEFHESSVDVRLFGKLTCLGLSKAINVSIDDGGFSFELSGAVYGVFESDLMLTAGYGNPSQANLTVTGCIPKAIPNVTYEVMTLLKDIRDDTREFLHSTRSRINELGVILEQSHKRMDIHNEQASSYKSKIEKEVSSLIQLQGKAQPCLNECKKVCMGVPGWSDDALTFDGYAIGSPKWKHCAHEVSDIVCVVRCLGRKVIKNVKAFNDQKKLQELLNVYERSTEQKKLSRGFLQKAIYVVGGMVTKLEKVDDKLSVGMSVVKSMIGNKFVELVSVDKVCIKGLLRDAVESQVRFFIKGKLIGKAVAVDVTASIDASLWKKLAVAMVEKMFPNATSFKDEKMKLKKMLKDIDIEKENVLNELEYSIRKSDMETVSRKNVVTEEEDKLRTLAYKELPRYTLGNDRVVRLFSRSSPWALMQSNDPLEAAFSFRNKTRISKLGGGKARYDTEKGTKKSVCASVHDAMQDYADILRVASGIAENFFEEKIAYLKSKNKHLATLRDIEDQIKSDCYLENCTVGEMNDALRYAIKAKNGFIQWMDSVKQQLKKHDRFALQVASKDIQTVIEKDKGMTMKEFIRSISNTFTKSYKRTLGEHQRGLSQLDQLDLDLRDILLNSRNRRVTTTAPLIFSMKNRFKSIKRTVVNECARKRETLSRKPND